jgi:uncharacterized membrane-anchored protein YitT (DUF2179 family)
VKIKSERLKDLAYFIVGCMVFSFGVISIIEPNEISPGGFTGIATVFNYWWGLPVGVTVFVLNIPLLILQYTNFGGSFVIKTAAATFILSMSLSVAEAVLPLFRLDGILAAVFGGLLTGFGLSLVLLRGATTGGADAVAKLINKRYTQIGVGRIIMLTDLVVIALSVIAYGNIESALYSVVTIYVSSRVIDAVLYGADKGKLIYIITDEPKSICREINVKLKRGVTALNGFGGYTRKEKEVLLCSVRKYEITAVYDIIRTFDPVAFVIVSDAAEITGQGFRKMQ